MDLEYGFKVEFSTQSIFNQTEYIDRYAKAAQYGLPVKTAYATSLSLSPSDIWNLTYLEEDILGLGKSKWLAPLVSSNTQSSVNSTVGRPTNESQGKNLTESGEQSKENDVNANR